MQKITLNNSLESGEIRKIVDDLYKKAHEGSCFYCSALRIQNGKIWCKFEKIKPFSILEKKELAKNRRKICKRNTCVLNDYWFE